MYKYYFLVLLMLVFFSCSQGNDKDEIRKSVLLEAQYDLNDDKDIDFLFDFDEMPDPETLSSLLTDKLDTAGLDPYFPNNRERRELEDKLKGIYEEKDHKLFWTSSDGVTSQARELLEAIQNVSEEGLNPDHYNLKRFESLLKKVKVGSIKEHPENLVDLDLLFTSTYLVLASDMSSGRLNPYKFDEKWIPAVPEKDLKDHLLEAFESNNIKESIFELIPDHPQYKKLKEALAHYVKIEAEHDWEIIEVDSIIQKGDSGQIISEIKNRLQLLGDFNNNNIGKDKDAIFDEYMEAAVKSFQKRHGLTVDGILGTNTYSKLNIPIDEKINKIKLNLERVRWLPRDLGDEYIMVNVPEFKLRIYENKNIVDEMRVIVGKEYNSTPIFSDTLEYLTFSPTWSVPVSIFKDDFYDKLVDDPGYLEKNHYELYPDWNKESEPIDPYSIDWKEIDKEEINYRLVQKPGPWNALGQVKFMMPNKMAIYLHDTPTEHLFDAQERGFSHGCIRVERPIDLAEFLLKGDPSWDRRKIYEFLNLDEPENVILPNKVPVHIVYKTTWVDDEDKINFLPDIYNHDEIQLISLEKTLNKD